MSDIPFVLRNLNAEIETRTRKLVDRIEQEHPGHRFGMHKHLHQQRLAKESYIWAQKLGLNRSEMYMLTVIMRTHDIGRHIEALNESDTSRTQVRHGYQSREFVENLPSWPLLPTRSRHVIAQAIMWHAERVVPEPGVGARKADTLAYKLCYLLRDLDKEDLLGDSRFVNPAGIMEQFTTHYERHGKSFDSVLSGDIPQGQIDKFTRGETLRLEDILLSYSTYMLVQLATIFDIKLPEVKRLIADNPKKYLFPRLKFIKPRVSSEQFATIVRTLSLHLEVDLSDF